MPIGDLQVGSPGFDEAKFRKHIEWGVRNGCLFHGMGDYSDFLSPSNRKYLKNAGLYDTAISLIEEWTEEQIEKIIDMLRPSAGLWTGMHEGHHLYEFFDGTTTDTRLCTALGAKFLGTAAVTRLTFKNDELRRKQDCLIWSHHGEGGGQDPLNRLLKVAPGFPQVDIFLQGHNTQIDARPKDKIEFYGRHGHLKMRDRTQMFVATGGFMRGYQQGSKLGGGRGRAQGSYVEKGMMAPTAIGGPLIYITPRAKSEYSELDIKASV